MKKYFLSFFVVIAFAFYAALVNQGSMDVIPATGNPVAVNAGTPAQTPAPTPAPTPTPATTQQPAMGGMGMMNAAYKNGSYTGPVTDAYYGPMQVEAVISGGQLSDVKILQSPTSHSYSVQVNGYALPQLVQEAIQAQNANVNIVSGATQSSYAFQQSLAAALASAKA